MAASPASLGLRPRPPPLAARLSSGNVRRPMRPLLGSGKQPQQVVSAAPAAGGGSYAQSEWVENRW